MQTDVLARTSRFILSQRMLHAGARIGVAVSGGADSVALLLLLQELGPKLGWGLSVAHFNHQLRGLESDQDEQFVSALAAEKGLALVAGTGNVRAEAASHGWNIEDAARRLRYGFFSSLVEAGKFTHVAVAHTADDQAETVLARLIRGTGPGGLASIYPVNGHVIRPLLEIRRGELREYLNSRGHTWREDSSNQDTTRLRARLRHDVLPFIETTIQPAIFGNLGRLAGLAREDEAFWTAFIRQLVRALVQTDGSGASSNGIAARTAQHAAIGGARDPRRSIRCADLLAPLASFGLAAANWQPDGRDNPAGAVTRRLVRGILEDVRGDCRQITAQHVEQVIQLASSRSGGHRTELPGVVVERSFEWLHFDSANPPAHRRSPRKNTADESGTLAGDENSPRAHELEAPGYFREFELGHSGEVTVVSIPEISGRFVLKVIDWPCRERETIHSGVLDRDLLLPPLVLRNWRPGDCFRPYGRRSDRKVKHFLREGKIPLSHRAIWPVMTSNESVIWVSGMPAAASFAPGETTRQVVVIEHEEVRG